jgi:hypothetical protein
MHLHHVQKETDQRKGNGDLEKEMAIDENWTVIPGETEEKHPPTHATPSIKKTYLNYHTTKDWPWQHTFLLSRIPSTEIESPACTCGYHRQTPKQLLLECKIYNTEHKQLRKDN